MFFDNYQLGSTVKQSKKVNRANLIVTTRKKHNIQHYTDNELFNDRFNSLVYDVESYPNFFCITFMNLAKTRICVFESSPDSEINIEKLRFIMFNFQTTGFNNHKYDVIMISAVLAGITNPYSLHQITKDLIEYNFKQKEIEKKYGFKVLSLSRINSIDIIEVCPLVGSLKTYSARVHAERLQDLPIKENTVLTKEQSEQIKDYNITDDINTIGLIEELADQLSLRASLSNKYQIDLRSKSDAQIAEAVIASEIQKITGRYPAKPKLRDDYVCTYKAPEFISFQTDYLKELLKTIESLKFELDGNGSPKMPTFLNGTFEQIDELDDDESDYSSEEKKELKRKIKLKINKTSYTVGIGGLHSCEKSIKHLAIDGYKLYDNDVESYYPRIKIICNLFPKHIGPAYLKVYSSLVDRRVAAKAAKNNVEADSLKITINGAFGKLGSKYSVLYSPDLMLAVTITGQLSLLMVIEMLELAGIEVVSANTDGIVVKCHDSKREEMLRIFQEWRGKTGFKTEETEYSMLLSRDVNNYIAVKPDGKVKLKGAYSNPWSDKKTAIFRFHKNPMSTVCIEAVCDFLTKQTPLKQTIKNCNDIKKFVCVKNVRGGGYKGNEYLGKVVRWYYAENTNDAIYYVGSGNKVGESDGAKPIMDFPDDFPNDLDYSAYIQKAYNILTDIGFYDKASLF